MVRRAPDARFANETATLVARLALHSRADFVFAHHAYGVARLRHAFLLLSAGYGCASSNAKANCRALQRQSRLLQSAAPVATRARVGQSSRDCRWNRRLRDLSNARPGNFFQRRNN